MHELSICQQLIAQVERIAISRCATSVDRIVVSAGPLSGVEAPLLQQAFSIASAGSLAQHASLEIDTGKVVIRCRSCGHRNEASANRLLCDACGEWWVEVLEGTELMLVSVELSGMPAPVQGKSRPAGAVKQREGPEHV